MTMTRATQMLGLSCLAGIALIFACTPSGEGDDGEYVALTATPTPEPGEFTPEPTEAPTPDPYIGYNITSLVVEGSNGVDLDEDGAIDNDYVETLEVLAEAVTDGFFDQCKEILSDSEITDNPTALCRSAAAVVEKTFASLVNLETLNESVAAAISDPRITYLGKFGEAAAGSAELNYHWGEEYDGYFYTGYLISTHSGPMDTAGNMTLGPGEFSLALKIIGVDVSYMELVKARTEANYALTSGITNARLGGVLTEDALVAIMIEAMASVADLPEPILNQLGQAIADLIPDCGTSGTVMSDCEELGGIAMGLTYRVDAVEVD